MAEKAALKQIPGFSQGVRANSAVRTLKMASPICPYSQQEMIRQPGGGYVPKDRGPNQQNCQLEGKGWWVNCQQRGHDPYFRVKVWYEDSDRWEMDENGDQVKTGTKQIRREEKIPNVVQVPISRRIGSGDAVRRSMENKGRLRLGDIGYAEVCQFRNCQKPIDRRFRSRVFGDYCSSDHMARVAADAQGVMLPQVLGFEGPDLDRVRQTQARMLREATAFADVEGG